MKRLILWFCFLYTLIFFLNVPFHPVVSMSGNQQLVLLIHSSHEQYSSSVYANVLYTLQKNGFELISWDIGKYDYLPELTSFPIIGFVIEDLSELNMDTSTNLKEYVRHGGKLIQFTRGYSDSLAELFSIDRKYTPTPVKVNGLRFFEDFIPGATRINLKEEYFQDDSFVYSSLGNLQPIAVSYSGVPLLWETRYGQGITLFWNTSVLANKAFRGFIVASITRYLSVSVRKVIGKSVMFVDDFPSSSWRAKLEPTYSELGVTDTGFYSKVLLNDLVSFYNQYSLRYSTVVVFNYNNLIDKPPYTFFDWDNCNIVENGKTINVPSQILQTLKDNPEIFDVGFHGYNHIQLTLPSWYQDTFMKLSLGEARKKWLNLLAYPPTFYVPPMNEIDRVGFSSLLSIFPEIKTMCSVYDAETDLGQNREFGLDPWDSQILDIPRCTSGFYLNAYDKMIAYSTMEAFGIWTHFIHPDDIFSNPTNYPHFPIQWIRNQQNLPWYGESSGKNGLYYLFQQDLTEMNYFFPWIEYSTVTDSRQDILHFSQSTDIPILKSNRIEFTNHEVERYIIDLPEFLTLSPNDHFEVISSHTKDKKKRYLIEVKDACIVPLLLR